MRLILALWAVAVPALVPATAWAYIGPGAGIGAMGAVVGVLLALITAVGVLILWPIRAVMRRRGLVSAASTAPSGEVKEDNRGIA